MGFDSALTIPANVTTKADFDKWIDNEVGTKLTTTQKDALKTDISAKLGLDMGNAITAYGRATINADLQYLFNNPNATTIPKLDSSLKPGDANGPGQLDSLRAKSNQFSDPFLIDLAAVLALMHETSEKLRSATKELRLAEHQNSQSQLQAAAEQIKSAGAFQAMSGMLSGAMSIAGGAAQVGGAMSSLGTLKGLSTSAKSGFAPEIQPQSTPKDLGQLKAQWQDGVKPSNGTPRGDVSKVNDHGLGVPKNKIKADIDQVKKDLDAPKTDAAPTMTRTEFDIKLQEVQQASQKWQGLGMMLDGVGKAMGASLQGASSAHEAERALKEKESQEAQFQKDTTNDLVKTLTDFSQQIRQTIQSLISSQDQAAQRVANV